LKKERSKKYRAIQLLRIFTQIFFFGLFSYLLLTTRFPGEDYIGNLEIFFHFDPLLALATLISSRILYTAFILSAITLVFTLFFGRFVCGWICPLGSVHQFFSFIFKKAKLHKPKKQPRKLFSWKYYLLIFVLAASIFTLDIVGIFDPLSFLYRSFATAFIPVIGYTADIFIGILFQLNLTSLGETLSQFFMNLAINTIFLQGFFIGTLFIGVVLLNLYQERFWCRNVCPLGALLGLISRLNLFKLKINKDRCIECNLCNLHCQTQANPFPSEEWRSSECIYCFTCSAICPTNAIEFPVRFSPEKVKSVDLSRRKLIFTSILGMMIVPFFRLTPKKTRASDKLIRPPGSLPEDKFLQKCIKCGECMKVCPTNAIQPALTEAGPEGIWTPRLDMKVGYCEYYCSLCTQVCPTGAIQELTIEEKLDVKIGTSWIDKNRCIPWTFGNPCIVCEEHCPVSPKAIKLIETEVKLPDGQIKSVKAPFIDIELCTGCGICENKCPVVDAPAIYVTSVGESRSERNQLLLDTLDQEGGPY